MSPGPAEIAWLAAALNELLEAERAGARVALDSAKEAGPGPTGELLREVQRDEGRWCEMLNRQIKALGAAPSAETGAFHGKAMAIVDLQERLSFLNRGQGWVVKRLREILPRLPEGSLCAELREMLESHQSNIARLNDLAKQH